MLLPLTLVERIEDAKRCSSFCCIAQNAVDEINAVACVYGACIPEVGSSVNVRKWKVSVLALASIFHVEGKVGTYFFVGCSCLPPFCLRALSVFVSVFQEASGGRKACRHQSPSVPLDAIFYLYRSIPSQSYHQRTQYRLRYCDYPYIVSSRFPTKLAAERW